MEVQNISVELQNDFKTIKKNPLNISLEERKCLVKFREAVGDIENLYCPLDDEFLIKFLRAKNCNIKKSLSTIKLYYQAKLDNESFENVEMSRLETMYKRGGFNVLKNRDKGQHIIYFRADAYEPFEFTEDEFGMAIALLVEEMTSIEETQRNGILFIADYSGFTFTHARAAIQSFSIKRAKATIKIIQGGLPIKMKGGYAINFPYAMQGLWKLLKPLFKEKMRNRIFVSKSSWKCIHEHIDPSILPVTLGGPLPLEEAIDSEIIKSLVSKEKHYKKMFEYGFKKV